MERRDRVLEFKYLHKQVDDCSYGYMVYSEWLQIRKTMQQKVERNILRARLEVWGQLWKLHYVE
jgi:hypothetical protein